MGKSKSGSQSGGLFPEVEQIAGVLCRESEQEVVILIIPSHDKRKQALNDQDQWAQEGMELLADLYQGATAFRGCKGIFKTDDGDVLWDDPILLESYATHKAIQDVERLNRLSIFLRRLGKTTKQDTVMLVVGTAFIYITDYSGV